MSPKLLPNQRLKLTEVSVRGLNSLAQEHIETKINHDPRAVSCMRESLYRRSLAAIR
jgi:hypothetical protein